MDPINWMLLPLVWWLIYKRGDEGSGPWPKA